MNVTILLISLKIYVENMLDKFDMSISKVPYVRVIGCLMYDMVYTRPYLAEVVSQVCKFMFKPRNRH